MQRIRWDEWFLAVLVLVSVPSIGPAQEPPEESREESPVLGAPSDFELRDDSEEHLRLEAGTRIYRQPAFRSPVLYRVDTAISLPVIERLDDGWVQVLYGSWNGWVALPAAASVASSAARPGVDPARLAAARALLGAAASVRTLGPYTLYTDVGDEGLLRHLGKVAEHLPASYERRFGIRPVPGDEAVVLFAGEQSYDEYLRSQGGEIADLASLGHAGRGLAVVHAEIERDALGQMLVHELTHLLNRTVLPPDLPPWLEEGLAEDLSYCRVDGAGRLKLGTLDGGSRTISGPLVVAPDDPRNDGRQVKPVDLWGPRSHFATLLRLWDDPERPPPAVLVDLPWSEFVVPERRPLYYPMSAFLIRYLLADERSDRARGFREFLQAAAHGQGASPDQLRQRLGTTWAELEAGLERWLEKIASGLGLLSSK
ncbi:MAG: hypothetical protein GY856_05820 [bacterium]|nr:hypothetical protein [bacterium]